MHHNPVPSTPLPVQALLAADLLTFGVLALRSGIEARRHPRTGGGWFAATFAVLAAIEMSAFVLPALPAGFWTDQLGRLVGAGLVLFPYGLYRFTEAFWRPTPRLTRTATWLTSMVVLVIVAAPGIPTAAHPARPPWYDAYEAVAVSVWMALAATSATRLWRAGAGQPAVTRRRMRLLSAGAVALALALALLLAATSTSPAAYRVAIQLVATVSGLLFFVGYSPTPGLRLRWRRQEVEAIEAASDRLMTVTDRAEAAAIVLTHAAQVLGATSAFMTDAECGVTFAQGITDAQAQSAAAHLSVGAAGDLVAERDQVATRLRTGWLAVVASPCTPVFGRDELSLLGRLGRVADLAFERIQWSEAAEASRRRLAERESLRAPAESIAHMGSFRFDLATGTRQWSDELWRIFDRDPSAGVPDHDTFMSWVHPDDRERVAGLTEEFDALVAERDAAPVVSTYRITLRDGAVRWVRLRAERSQQAGSPTASGVGMVQDITAEVDAERVLRDTELRMQLLVDSMTDYAIVLLDHAGHVVTWNPGAEQIFGFAAADVIGQTMERFDIAPDGDTRSRDLLAHALAHGQAEHESARLRADGSEFIAHVLVTVLRGEADDVQGFAMITRDVTEGTRATLELHERERQLAEAQELAHLGSWQRDLTTGAVTFSHEFARLLGLAPSEDVGDASVERLLAFVHPEDRALVSRAFTRSLEALEPFVVVHRACRRDGVTRWFRSQGRVELDASGQAQRVVGSAQDITEQKEAEDALVHQALHDPLTGLPNRALFLDRLEQVMRRRRREPSNVAVLFADLDRFKWVNDSLGHAAGDRLLAEVAERLAAAARAGDTIARFGGDEFVVLCEEVADAAEAVGLAQRFAAAIALPVAFGESEVIPTASIGIALTDAEDAAPEGLVRDADAAMYEAKQRGGDRVQLFGSAMRVRVSRRLDLESQLRHAMTAGELRVHYQPSIDLSTGAVAGFEALARWQHPERGLLPPSEFVPVAEETGLIIPLGAHILETACHQARAWTDQQKTPLLMAVNLSARQLLTTGLVERLTGALQSSGLPADCLCVEITESVLLDDAETSARVLGEIRDLGVQIAVDDFGTGYSSLTYLKRFPLSVLKIDRSFVSGVSESSEDRAVVAGVIDLGHAFGLRTTAEGVETIAQLATLQRLGCEEAQGYLWSPAVAPDAMSVWLPHHSKPGLSPTAPAEGRSVLVIEDDRSIRQLVCLALGDDRHTDVHEARDGREGVSLAGRLQPDLVLLDLAMPGMGGLEALPLLSAVSPRSRVVILSGIDDVEVESRALREGAAGFISKRSDLSALRELIEPILAARP